MDLERIKQNLRLRSGRTKKIRKAPSETQTASRKLNKPPANPANPPTGSAAVDRRQESLPPPNKNKVGSKDAEQNKILGVPGSVASLPLLDRTPVQRRELPDSATGINFMAKEPRSPMPNPDRYGRSGIERRRRSSHLVVIERRMTEPKVLSSDETDLNDFDLRPPPRKPKPPSLENLAELLFSAGHLDTIIHDPQLLLRLNTFLSRYKSDLSPLLIRYLETQKAIKAVEYANAVAGSVTSVKSPDETDGGEEVKAPNAAARIDEEFAKSSKTMYSALLSEGLPAYITYQLVKVATDCLTNEITGHSTPIMRDLVGGLSEIFCLTDPNQEDNPIIYASEEFYRLTGYDATDVIGSNCRFLQGPKTKKSSPKRLRDGQEKGEQVCETLLNYRRDGRAFINLLMIAPLFDDKNKLKYYIGAQVDVSGLVEGGKSLDGFEKYLAKQQREAGRSRTKRDASGLEAKKAKALEKLKELSEMFDLEESAVVQSHSRSSSMTRGDNESINSKDRPRTARRVLADSSQSDEEESDHHDNSKDDAAWKLAKSGPSGRLPGVYQSYLLMRAAPSLRIVFVSPALRKLGDIMQSPFLSHVAAPSSTLAGLKESFESGAPVTAKVGFMPKAGKSRDGLKVDRVGGKRGKDDDEDAQSGRTCWISATPMLGADDQVGVWMVVIVLKPRGTSRLPSKDRNELQQNTSQRPNISRKSTQVSGSHQSIPTRISRSKMREKDTPIKPERIDSIYAAPSRSAAAPSSLPESRAKTADEIEADDQDEYEQEPKSDHAMNANPRDTILPQTDPDQGDYVQEINDQEDTGMDQRRPENYEQEGHELEDHERENHEQVPKSDHAMNTNTRDTVFPQTDPDQDDHAQEINDQEDTGIDHRRPENHEQEDHELEDHERENHEHAKIGQGKYEEYPEEDDHDSEDDVLVQRHDSRPHSQQPECLHIQPDSVDDEEAKAPTPTDPNFIAPSPPNDIMDDQHSDHDHDTITNYSSPSGAAHMTSKSDFGGKNEISCKTSHEVSNDDVFADTNSESESTLRLPNGNKEFSSRPASARGQESNSTRPSRMLYMDYLRHPGSGHQRSASGRAYSNGSDDPDCARSPYSVD